MEHKRDFENNEEVVETLNSETDYTLSEEARARVMHLARRGEARPLGYIEDGLKHAIIGQDEAVESLMIALNREKLRNPNRPISTLFFLGPTGVGKSEMAKELARLLHPEGGGFLKINCETYRYGHNIAALIGSPPGYVGREQKALFDSPELKKPRCVVLFDEIEKGGQELRDLQLQIIEDGELTMPGNGRTQSFKECIIIMTSNLGAAEIATLLGADKLGFSNGQPKQVSSKQIENEATRALEREFRPEYINRFDRRVIFGALDDHQLGEVLERHVEKSNDFYKKQAGISLTLTPEVRDALVQSCDTRRKYGARPILRKFEQLVEGLLADYVNSGGIPEGSQVVTSFNEDLPEDTPLPERIELRYYQEQSTMKHMTKSLEKIKKKNRSTAEQPTDPLFSNKNLALGAVALGVAALIFGSGRGGSARRA